MVVCRWIVWRFVLSRQEHGALLCCCRPSVFPVLRTESIQFESQSRETAKVSLHVLRGVLDGRVCGGAGRFGVAARERGAVSEFCFSLRHAGHTRARARRVVHGTPERRAIS